VLLVDTAPLVAAADEDDARHHDCRRLLESSPGPLVTNAMVVAEASYLIARQLGAGADARLLDSIVDGTLRVEHLVLDDFVRAAALVREYASLRLGATDASLVALAERLGVTVIATLNHRDFAVVRPRHVEAFELLP
jgi:predicted nucleic acid-binding protein